mmetsp:Transcript_39321/g.123139  ORF Transcript_39321/g.123139 Transcript_39321/m.123139 type:complete len:98 (-) Transcript_39321:901-1194(-)
MEFFLQTLVKRRYMSQRNMLRLNMLLMVVSSVAALQVLYQHVCWPAALLSLLLNLFHRHHEVENFCLVLGSAYLLRQSSEFGLGAGLGWVSPDVVSQ